MTEQKNMIVGYDGSAESKSALLEAARLAAASDAHLLVLEVIHEELVTAIERETGVAGEDVVAARGLRLEHEIEGLFSAKCAAPKMTSRIVRGHPFSDLMRACEETGADLLVLGATGTTGLKHSSLGAVARSAVRHAPCETLLVRGAVTDGFKQVVCGIDFSSTSARALKRAGAIAKADGSKFALVAVYTPDWLDYIHEYGGGVEVPSKEVADRYALKLADKLSEFVAAHSDDFDGLDGEIVTLQAVNAPVGICDLARQVEADLVVIGSVGRARDDVRPLGSTAEYVIHSAGCSVLAVRPEEASERE